MVEVLKVSGKSNPNSVAGALAGVLRSSGAVDVQVVGAGALNQAIKAIAIARGFVAPSNIDLVCIPTFADIQIDGQRRTAIRLAVENRPRHQPVTNPATSSTNPAATPAKPATPATNAVAPAANAFAPATNPAAPSTNGASTSTSGAMAGAVAEAFATSEPAVASHEAAAGMLETLAPVLVPGPAHA